MIAPGRRLRAYGTGWICWRGVIQPSQVPPCSLTLTVNQSSRPLKSSGFTSRLTLKSPCSMSTFSSVIVLPTWLPLLSAFQNWNSMS